MLTQSSSSGIWFTISDKSLQVTLTNDIFIIREVYKNSLDKLAHF